MLGAQGVVERLQHLHLLLLLLQQVLLPVPVVPAPQHILVHLRIAAFILQKAVFTCGQQENKTYTYVIVVPLIHRIVDQCGWQEVGG